MEKAVVLVLIFIFWGLKLETLTFGLMKMFNFKCIDRKRSDYLEWPDYFMAIAFLSAQRSKDPRTQVGFQYHQYAMSQICHICSYFRDFFLVNLGLL